MLLPVTELRTKAQHRSCTGKEGRTEATHAHCDINAPRIHTERQHFMHEREHLQSEHARGDGGLARGQKPTLVGEMCGEPTTGANSRMQLGLAAANTRDQPGQQETHWEVWTSEPCVEGGAWRGVGVGGDSGEARAGRKHQEPRETHNPRLTRARLAAIHCLHGLRSPAAVISEPLDSGDGLGQSCEQDMESVRTGAHSTGRW